MSQLYLPSKGIKLKSLATKTPKPKRPKSGKAALALAETLVAEAGKDNGEMF